MQPDDKRNPLLASEVTRDASKKVAPKRRPGGRSMQVQAAVFNATMELLLTKSYEAITIAEIASRYGIHETSIYRRPIGCMIDDSRFNLHARQLSP